MQKFLTEQQVSELFGISVSTLQKMRAKPGRDPIPFVKVGGSIRYREDHLKKWIDRNTFDDVEQAKEYRKTGS